MASEPATFTWSISPQTRAAGGITRYSGIDSLNPIDVSGGAIGRGTVASAPSLTTTVPNAQVIAVFASNYGANNSASFSTSTGMTMQYTTKNTPFGPSTALEDMTQVNSGTTGVKTSIISQGPQRDWVAQQIVLRPYVPPVGIAFDATSSALMQETTSLTFSHTTSGTNRILFVGVNEVIDGGAPDLITGVTYNGIPMNRVSTANPFGVNWRGYVYALVNPSLGTHDVVISSSAATYIAGMGVSYTGVDQGSQPDAVNSNSCPNFSTSCAVSVTPVKNGSWVIGFYTNSNGHDALAGLGTSVRSNFYGGAWLESAINPITPASAVTLNADDGASSFGAMMMEGVSISPAGF